MVANLQWVERMYTAVQPTRRAQDCTLGDVTIPADGDCDAGGVGLWRGVAGVCGGGCRRETVEVASNHSFGLDDGFTAENDVLSAVDLGAARDLVARVLLRVNLGCYECWRPSGEGVEAWNCFARINVPSQCTRPWRLWEASWEGCCEAVVVGLVACVDSHRHY